MIRYFDKKKYNCDKTQLTEVFEGFRHRFEPNQKLRRMQGVNQSPAQTETADDVILYVRKRRWTIKGSIHQKT